MADRRSLSDVFQDIVRNVQEIVRAEIELAKTETRAEIMKALSSFAWLIAGAMIGLFAVGFALWTITYALALIWPLWAALLALTVLLAVGATMLIVIGKKRLAGVRAAPERTLETIKDNVEWLKQSTK
jgi:VIT1/CCC1 family predicted Fe2+/Mn2+ transporter